MRWAVDEWMVWHSVSADGQSICDRSIAKLDRYRSDLMVGSHCCTGCVQRLASELERAHGLLGRAVAIVDQAERDGLLEAP